MQDRNTPEKKWVIVGQEYGSFVVFPATRARVMALFDNYKIHYNSHVKEVASDAYREVTKMVCVEFLADALMDVAKLPEGAVSVPCSRLFHGHLNKRDRPVVTIQAAWKKELADYLMENDLSISTLRKLGANNLNERKLHRVLPFLAPLQADGRETVYVYGSDLDVASEFRTIERGRWKEGAPEQRVIGVILEFINTNMVSRSDVHYEQVQMDCEPEFAVTTADINPVP